ncbi:MAG: type II toxin-antitoxin system HicB family antitoxin [Nitrospinae bacterium]|nr:type II toxin-antitoxin system HicB family antitoxin [Nitrospinota bacterium]
MKKYAIVVMYDPEYKGYVVDVPELPGCMSQGKTVDDALLNIKDAIKGWLLAEKKKGRKARAGYPEMFIGEVAV